MTVHHPFVAAAAAMMYRIQIIPRIPGLGQKILDLLLQGEGFFPEGHEFFFAVLPVGNEAEEGRVILLQLPFLLSNGRQAGGNLLPAAVFFDLGIGSAVFHQLVDGVEAFALVHVSSFPPAISQARSIASLAAADFRGLLGADLRAGRLPCFCSGFGAAWTCSGV